jgi:predicted RNA-binding protein YlxR (DUF448 family)
MNGHMMGARTTSDDGGAPSDAKSLRLCAVSRTPARPEDLIRFVAGPNGIIVPDLARRLPGRGIWIAATRNAVEAAVRNKVFSRSLRRAVSVPEDLPGAIERLMCKRLAEAISLANKAGLLVAGFVKVDALIRQGRAALLVHAAEASPGGRAKLDSKFRALAGTPRAAEAVVNELTGPELDLAIGRSNVVHAAASEGGASRRILYEAVRLRRYRSAAEMQGNLAQDVHERDERDNR